MDSKLTSFVTALSEAASSEISSVTDPTYGPDSSGVGQSEVSSLTDPTYGSNSRGAPDAGGGVSVGIGVGESAIAMADAGVVGVGMDDGGRGSEISEWH